MGTVERSSVVPAAPADVWARITTPAGVNDELAPVMRMSVPRALRGATLDTVPLGKRICRSWLLLFGVLPFDWDDLTIVEREPGRRFREESTMLAIRRWTHERTVEPAPGGGTEIRDRLTFAPRLPGTDAVVARVIGALFAHRHRRLARHFAGPVGFG